MTAAIDPAPPPARPVRKRGRRALLVVGVVLGVLLVLTALLYLNRRAATRQVLIGWLEQQGIEADMQVDRLELDGLVARVRIGDAADPDVTVERVEVDYAIGAPWSKGGIGLTPTRIRLIRPVVRASVRNGKLTLGSLDPLVERTKGRPLATGAVRGREIYGQFPVTALGTAEDLGSGRLLPSTAVTQLAGDLGRWMGLSSTELGYVLPNLGAFSPTPLGLV